MKGPLFYFGLSMFIVFGGAFLVRYMQNSSFYVVEAAMAAIGVIMFLASFFAKNEPDHRSEVESL
ncbi:hypothetical protein [Bacillus testis]|uniref:hypothetical protein n=1 Tax=Bacillus testis TaxID=1622072 RepID=UPI00067E74CF|nr:hypothetical protein [Bacillus testis]